MELIEYTNYPRRVKGDLRIFYGFQRMAKVVGHIPRNADTPSFRPPERPRLDGKRRPFGRPVDSRKIRGQPRKAQDFQFKGDEG